MPGVDFATVVSPAQFACLAAANVTWAITRSWHSYGAFDNNSIANLANAQAAGILSTDVYLFPCAGRPAADQATEMVTALGASKFGRVWIDVEENPSKGCSWTMQPAKENCVFLHNLTTALQQVGVAVGIYSNHHGWSVTAGLDCTFGDEFLPLWYAHYDEKADTCSDFMAFGGWTSPFAKQYTDQPGTPAIKACGVGVDTSSQC
jgi:GH25 family lysozyme M1 (1,4-beta-N-acetylmuramidase)